MLNDHVALKDVGRVPSGSGHQKHLVSISKKKKQKVCPVKNGWAPCGRKRLSRVSDEKNWGTCGEIKQVTEGQYYHYTSVSQVLEAL